MKFISLIKVALAGAALCSLISCQTNRTYWEARADGDRYFGNHGGQVIPHVPYVPPQVQRTDPWLPLF